MTYLLVLIAGAFTAYNGFNSKAQNKATRLQLIIGGFLMGEGLTFFLVDNVFK